MKILLLKTEGSKPHLIRQEHIDQLKAVDSSIEVEAVLATDTEEVNRHFVDAEIMAGVRGTFPSSIATAKNLKWIQAFAAGVDYVLTDEIKSSDVIVGNSSGIHSIPIAEHILGFLLIFTRKFHVTFAQQQQKKWEKQQEITELREKSVLIVGLGHIGYEAARVVSCVGAKVLAVDRPGKEKPDFVSKMFSTDEMSEALSQADFVVLSLPYTPETHHLFDMEKFRIMKDTAVLINIGRGGVIHEEELIDALKQKIIAGAALDVTETEPLPVENPLWSMENVVITPHHSGHSEKYMDRAIDLFCINLQAYIQGRPLPNLVDKQKGY